MHTARVLSNVAADAARNLRRRIGRVIKSVRGSRLTDCEIAHPGLNRGRSSERVDLGDPIEFGHPQQHALGMGHRPTRKSSSGAPCDDRYRQTATDPQDLNHVRLCLGQDHHHG